MKGTFLRSWFTPFPFRMVHDKCQVWNGTRIVPPFRVERKGPSLRSVPPFRVERKGPSLRSGTKRTVPPFREGDTEYDEGMNPKVQGPEKDALLRPLTVAWFLVICDSSAGGTGGTDPFVPDLELKGLSLSVIPSIEEKQRLYPLHPMIEEKQYLSMEQKWNEKDRPLVPPGGTSAGARRDRCTQNPRRTWSAGEKR